MISVSGDTITMTRGDTETLTVTVLDSDGESYTLGEDEYIELCIKASVDDDTALVVKTTTDGDITFDRDDTWSMDVGKYVYNIRVEDGSTSFHTIIEGKFVLKAVVDDASDD